MFFQHTIWFWGFAGLLIPVIIHLLSKKTRKVIPFGSLKFLKSNETKTIRSLQPSDLWMLLLRSGIISILVMILVSVFIKEKRKPEMNMIISEDYRDRKEIWELMDTVSENVNIFWEKDQYTLIEHSFNSYNFIDSNVLIAPLYYSGLDFKLPESTLIDRWIALPEEKETYSLMSVSNAESGISLIAHTDESATFTAYVPATQKGENILIKVFIHSERTFENYLKIVNAAISAINESGPALIQKVDDKQNADWIIWLSNEAFRKENKTIILGETTTGELIEKLSGRTYILNNNLSDEIVLKKNLPLQLQRILYSDLIAYDKDLRQIPESVFPFNNSQRDEEIFVKTSMNKFLWIVLVFLLLVERFLSTRRI